jgi:hypothetical protein
VADLGAPPVIEDRSPDELVGYDDFGFAYAMIVGHLRPDRHRLG